MNMHGKEGKTYFDMYMHASVEKGNCNCKHGRVEQNGMVMYGSVEQSL